MPVAELLESYPLFKKYKTRIDDSSNLNDIHKPAIHMHCTKCASEQTFNMVNQYYEGYSQPNIRSRGRTVTCRYLCARCKSGTRSFYVYIDENGEYLMKVGQMPPVEISIDKNLEKSLGLHSGHYKKGVVCESQGYGIGAFAYFRRITEDIIDELLESISDLIEEDGRKKYVVALEKVKETTVTQEKINLVKDLLPSSLRPGGMNPLGVLHKALSEGLHVKADEDCLELAGSIRGILEYLVNQVLRSKEEGKKFTESMKKLLEKRSDS